MTERRKKDICRFKKFLVKEHVLITFINNIEEDTNYFKTDFEFQNLKEYFESDITPENLLSHSFDWSHSKQGHEFWEKLDYKWRKVFREGI